MEIKSKFQKMLVFLILLVLAAVVLFPILSLLNISLKTSSEYLKDPAMLVKNPTLDNFIAAFTRTKIAMLFKNSLIFLVFGTVFAVGSALLVAFPVARKRIKGHKLVYSLMLSSMMLPPSLIPLYGLMSQLHLINTYHGLIMYYMGSCAAVSVFILTGFVSTVPEELDEAAFIDGCGYFRYLWSILLPLMKSAIATVSMFVALSIWNDFMNPFLFLTNPKKRNIASGIYMLKGEYTMSVNLFAAALIMILIPLTVVYIFFQQHITESLTGGAIKG